MSAARMGVLAGKAALVTGGSYGSTSGSVERPTPDGAAVETTERPPTMNMAMARPGRWLSGGRNSVDGMSVDLLGRHEKP
jgi:hypothetical protein